VVAVQVGAHHVADVVGGHAGRAQPDEELVGGQLLVGLRAAGVTPHDVSDVVCTHLHSDHVGWLFDLDAQPMFPRARIWFGAGDWDHFVRRDETVMAEHIRHGFRSQHGSHRLQPLDRDTLVAPGLTALLSPGHTPGHLCVVVASGEERGLLLGDAVTCPAQLDEPSWHSLGDVDPHLADRTRERLWRELEGERTVGAGAHFPELRFGRVLTGSGRRWWT
jgi:glyoxylase-like metal-dependent hydrolase (beta-lactamase superfamily II)